MPVLPGSVTNGSDIPGNGAISNGKALSGLSLSGEKRQKPNPFFGENGTTADDRGAGIAGIASNAVCGTNRPICKNRLAC